MNCPGGNCPTVEWKSVNDIRARWLPAEPACSMGQIDPRAGIDHPIIQSPDLMCIWQILGLNSSDMKIGSNVG